MKKIICLLSAILLVFTSCFKNDVNFSVDPILFRKVVNANYSVDIYTIEIVYNDNKIVNEVDSDGHKINYTYTGNVITKKEEIDKKGVIDETTEYGYTNGRLTTSLRKKAGDPYNYRVNYIYNLDGTVSYKEFMTNDLGCSEEDVEIIGKYTFKDGNLIKDECLHYGLEKVIMYEYDTEHSPKKNVLGFNLLFDNEPSVNNLVKRTYVFGSNTYVSASTYKYDVNGYPTVRENVEDENSYSTTKFFY